MLVDCFSLVNFIDSKERIGSLLNFLFYFDDFSHGLDAALIYRQLRFLIRTQLLELVKIILGFQTGNFFL